MSHQPTVPSTHAVQTSILSAFLYGVGGGLIGTAVMAISEKLEQNIITDRPSYYVPGQSFLRLLGRPDAPDKDMNQLNILAHYSFGAVGGAAKALMAWYGLKGPFANFLFIGIRLAIDQTLENWMGVGAAPWTWPVEEQIVDLVHKSVYGLVTGYLVDQWVV